MSENAMSLGKDEAIRLLLDQSMVRNNLRVAKAMYKAGCLCELDPGQPMVQQGEFTSDIFFILRGEVDVCTNGQRHRIRQHGQHIGEMALLEPAKGRSASVYAGCNGVIALKLSSSAFTKLGKKFPDLWRNIAEELSDRLRQRDAQFLPPNQKPKVFIASSGAAIGDMKIIEGELGKDNECDVIPWSQEDVFSPSHFAIVSLKSQADTVDFAVIIATPDDEIARNVERDEEKKFERTARDNVYLEYGLFSGALSVDRVFIVEKYVDETKITHPSDLQGLTTIRYADEKSLIREMQKLAKIVAQKGSMRRIRLVDH